MATLDAFLSRANKRRVVAQDEQPKHAFVSPSTIMAKKKALPTKQIAIKKTIDHYFVPAQDSEMEDVSPSDICVIRHRVPVVNWWQIIQDEVDQDPFLDIPIEQPKPTSRGRKRQMEDDDTDSCTNSRKKNNKKTDHELSSIMARFLNMNAKPTTQSVTFVQELDESDEDLSRVVRHKKTLKESHLFVYEITQEFLYC